MRRKDVDFRSPITVTRSVDTWVRLVHMLKEAEYGQFVVTVHNGQVTKVARIDGEVKITQMPHPKGVVPGP